MRLKALSAVIFVSLMGTSCVPTPPIKRPDIAGILEYYAYDLSGDHSILKPTKIIITSRAIYLDSLKEPLNVRYVLPQYSKDAFFTTHAEYGGSNMRPIDIQKTTLTYSLLESTDDLTSTITYKTLDLSNQPIVERVAFIPYHLLKNGMNYTPATQQEQDWLNNKTHFPEGAECYQIIEQSTNTDFIEYSIKDQLSTFTTDEHGNASGYKLQKFGHYEFYVEDGVIVDEAEPTPLILKMGSRYYNGSFNPKKTVFYHDKAVELAQEQLNKASTKSTKIQAQLNLDHTLSQCQLYNAIAAKSIDQTISSH